MEYILLMSPAGGEQSPFSGVIFLVLIIAVFYFFMIRPQMKKQKELRTFRSSIEKGDKVITTGGIYGKVLEVHEAYVFLEIDSNVKVKIDKGALLSGPQDIEQKR